jgi:hypothetical protein
LLAAILLAVVLAAGANAGVLDNYYLLKVRPSRDARKSSDANTRKQVDTSQLKLKPKLSSSEFLRDISQVSGANLVGDNVTAESLGLAKYYTVHIFTCCAHGESSTTCTTPLVGSTFDPRKNLKLEKTVLEGTYSDTLRASLDSYSRASPYLGFSLIISFVFIMGAPTSMLVSHKLPKMAVAAVVMSALAVVLLFTSAISASVALQKLRTDMNSEFGASGIDSSPGQLLAPMYPAIVLVVVETALLYLARRKISQQAKRSMRELKGKTLVSLPQPIPNMAEPQPPMRGGPYKLSVEDLPESGQARKPCMMGVPPPRNPEAASFLNYSSSERHSSDMDGGDLGSPDPEKRPRVISAQSLNNTKRKAMQPAAAFRPPKPPSP